MIGERIGAYRIVKKIGEGGMGTVWLAEHEVLGRRAAIKMLNGNVASQSDLRTRFFNEAKAAAAIQEPGIVQIFDFGQHDDGRAYIVMEVLEGEALDKRLERLGRLSLPEALRIAQQVAVSLGAAHQRGIVHRDLKPDNVFLIKDAAVLGGERTKLLDFGIAKLSNDGSKTDTKVVMGTPLFMSPEQCRGAGKVEPRSDLYSLGCLLFMMITGRPPFRGEGPGDIIAMHLREMPPVPSTLVAGLPHSVDSLVLRCLEKDPLRRHASAEEVSEVLAGILATVAVPQAMQTIAPRPEALAEGRRSSAHATTLQPYSQVSQPPTRAQRGRQRGLWLAAGGGTVLGVVAMVLAMRGGDAPPASLQPGGAPPAPERERPPADLDGADDEKAPERGSDGADDEKAPERGSDGAGGRTDTGTDTAEVIEETLELEGVPPAPPAPKNEAPAPVRRDNATPANPGKPLPVASDAPAAPAAPGVPGAPAAPSKPPRAAAKPELPPIEKLGTARPPAPPAPPPVDCQAETTRLEALIAGHYSMTPAAIVRAAQGLSTTCFSNKQLTRLLMISIPAACALDQKATVLRFYALAPSTVLLNQCKKYLVR